MRRIIPFLFIAFMGGMILRSCGGFDSFGPRKIDRLDLQLRSGRLPADSDMLHAARLLFQVSGYGELTDSSVSLYASMPSITLHERVVDSVFPSLEKQEQALGALLERASRELPGIEVKGIYAIVSPFNQSVFTIDSCLYIGLNHYLGTDYLPYSYFPDYVRRRKTSERIAPDVAEALVRGAYPAGDDGRVISRLLYEGAVAEAVMRLTDGTEALTLGYSPEEMKWLKDNEENIWKSLVERKLVFSRNPADVRALIAPGAVTTIIHPEAPGSAGRFVGHRILRSYLEKNPEISLDSLLSPGFYNSDAALRESRYNP